MRRKSILVLALVLGLSAAGPAGAGAVLPEPAADSPTEPAAALDPSDWLDRLLAGSFETAGVQLAVADDGSAPLSDPAVAAEVPTAVPFELTPALDASELGSLDGLGR